MAVASVSNSFAPNTLIESAEVNTNFADLVTFLNGSTMHRDASAAFTAVPSGPATDPTSANQLARKAYVDKIKPVARQVLSSSSVGFGPGPVDTDFELFNVSVDVLRAYEVCLHTRAEFTGVSTWEFNLHVNGAETARLDHKPIVGGDGSNMISVAALWLPSTGTPTLRVNVTRTTGVGTVSFPASGTAQRMFYVKDIGLR